MKELNLNHKDCQYKFRKLNESDADWLNSRFAEDGKPVGLLNFQERISNFDNYPVLAQTLTITMHYLCTSHKHYTLEEFENQFGIKYADIAVLYRQLNICLGNTQKDVKKAQKLVRKNRRLEKENRRLQFALAMEKGKNLRSNVKNLIQEFRA